MAKDQVWGMACLLRSDKSESKRQHTVCYMKFPARVLCPSANKWKYHELQQKRRGENSRGSFRTAFLLALALRRLSSHAEGQLLTPHCVAMMSPLHLCHLLSYRDGLRRCSYRCCSSRAFTRGKE